MKAILDLWGFTKTIEITEREYRVGRIDVPMTEKGILPIITPGRNLPPPWAPLPIIFKYHHTDGDTAIFYIDSDESGLVRMI